jgi:hypothetical protein
MDDIPDKHGINHIGGDAAAPDGFVGSECAQVSRADVAQRTQKRPNGRTSTFNNHNIVRVSRGHMFLLSNSILL